MREYERFEIKDDGKVVSDLYNINVFMNGEMLVRESTAVMYRARWKILREMLIDWYIAVDAQRYTGDPTIRNGVEHRMFEMAKQLYANTPGTPDGCQEQK